jgi:hypothetical protein
VSESSVEHSNVERGAFELDIGVKPAFDCRLSRGRASDGKVTGLQCRASSVRVKRRVTLGRVPPKVPPAAF